MRRTSTLCLAVGLAALALPTFAYAHIDLDWPPMRGGNQKTGPCEGIPLGGEGPLTVLRSGSELPVRITETIPHPGHFRVMIDADGGEDFPDPANCDDVGVPDGETLLADNVLPAQGFTCPDFHTPSERTPGGEYEIMVTLPDVECEACTLQVIQVMTDEGKADQDGNWVATGGRGLYFRCANIRLSRTEEPTPDPYMDMGSNPDAGPGTNPDPDPDPDQDPDGQPGVSGGCTAAPGGNGLAALAILALAIGFRRRRAS